MRFVYLYTSDKSTQQRIHVDEYTDTMAGHIFCPEGHPMIMKKGTLRTPHFAHKSGYECSCSEGKTEWHEWWQDRAKKDAQERRFNLDSSTATLTSNTKCHIADLCIDNEHLTTPVCSKGYVIEFQHSNMDEKTMRERERFYTSQGYHLVWVFDTDRWSFSTVRKSMVNGITTLTIRQKSGATFPLFGAYTGNVTKIFDFKKQELFIVTEQKGASITGRLITLDQFDSLYLGKMLANPQTLDMRPFHHHL